MVFRTVRSLGSSLTIFSYSAIALGSFPCWTNFSACARTFTLLNPNPSAIKNRKLQGSLSSAVGNCKRVQLWLKYHRKTAKPKPYGVIVSACRLFTLKVQPVPRNNVRGPWSLHFCGSLESFCLSILSVLCPAPELLDD